MAARYYESRHNDKYDKLIANMERRQRELIGKLYPSIGIIDDEIEKVTAERDKLNTKLEDLKKEREVLERLYGVEDV